MLQLPLAGTALLLYRLLTDTPLEQLEPEALTQYLTHNMTPYHHHHPQNNLAKP